MRLREENDRPVAAILATVIVLALLTGACDRHTRIPPSDYGEIEDHTTGDWLIEVEGATYRVRSFSVTDSTVIVEDAEWVEYPPTEQRYPAKLSKRVYRPDVPIVLPREDVMTVSRLEFSSGRTTLAALGMLLAIPAAVLFVAAAAGVFSGPVD